MSGSEARFVTPRYGVRSLADVVPAVARALGTPLPAGPVAAAGVDLPPAASYVVLLVDGLGARLLERYAHAAPYLSSLQAASPDPATAGVPSTTAASLTSFGTGLTPGTHGLVGFTSRVPGSGALHNNLWWSEGVDPLEWQPHPTAFDAMRQAGVSVTVVNRHEFARSGLTLCSTRGGEYVGADLVGERIAAAVQASAVTPSLTYLYDSDLDRTGHLWGVASSQWLQQLAMIDAEAEQLRESLPGDRRLVIVADHGMVDSAPADRFDVDRAPGLRDGVALLGGEARFRHVYCRGGAVDDVAAAWRETLADRAEVLTRSEAIARGWFGPVDAAVLPRIGDVVAAATGTTTLISSDDFPYEADLVGFHGSLTEAEMLIPVLLD